jgi:cyclopropane-fatty-acyl-phospholipid synthase
MNAPEGNHGPGNSSGLGLWDRLSATLYHRLLDHIDFALDAGRIEIFLPDGSFRVLGGRGTGPSCTVIIQRWRALVRMARSGSVGWYDGWVDGDWSSPDAVSLFDLFVRNRVTLNRTARAKGVSRVVKRARHALNRNNRKGARRNILSHYDLGNDFYAAWLDPTMTYSSAMFFDGDTLETAQRRKQTAILDRLDLKPAGFVLEIGCGWGSLAHAAHDRGANVTAISLSPGQLGYARTHHNSAIDFRLCDYRDITGRYDAVMSVEMVEAVGERYWPDYLDAIARCLKPGGRAALQLITIADDVFPLYRQSADFIQTYIFPGGMLISENRFRKLAEARGFIWRDEHRFGRDYAETLRLWRARFEVATLPDGFDRRFYDLWRYYLMYCEGGFRGGGIDVLQVTLERRTI